MLKEQSLLVCRQAVGMVNGAMTHVTVAKSWESVVAPSAAGCPATEADSPWKTKEAAGGRPPPVGW